MGTLYELVSHLTLSSILDILLVALILYGLFYLIQGTRAVQLLRGILLLIFLSVLASRLFQLTAFSWLIRNSIPALLVAIPVIFQPELRRALERLGRPGMLITRRNTAAQVIATVAHSASELAKRQFGALIVLEGSTGLQDYIDTGVPVDAQVTSPLLLTVFQKNSALHDGAAIMREDRLAAAACVLPLSENPNLDRDLGTRHRAAIGVSEGTDAIAIVISEENASISVAYNGRLVRRLDEGELNRLLLRLYRPSWTTERWRSRNGTGKK